MCNFFVHRYQLHITRNVKFLPTELNLMMEISTTRYILSIFRNTFSKKVNINSFANFLDFFLEIFFVEVNVLLEK